MNSSNGSIYYSLGLDLNQLRSDANRATSVFKNIGYSAVSEGAIIDKAFKNIARSIGAVFTIQQASSFIQSIANVRGEFQKLEVSFNTMLQSKSKADALMQQLVHTAAITPFDLQGVANGAKQLLAYGESADNVNDTLIRLGNVAAGLSLPLNDLVYLYGTTMVQGRLFTQDVRQFMGRGIPLVKELAKELGKTEEEINSMVTAGLIGFPEVQKVIENLTSEGGMFFNLMEEQSKTISGQIANLGDAWDMMLNNIGKESEGIISGAISSVASLVENYEQVGKVLATLVGTYGAYKAAVIALNVVQSLQTRIALESALAGRTLSVAQGLQAVATKQLSIAQAALNKTMLANPYVLAATAVVGLVGIMWTLHDSTTASEKALKDYNKKREEASQKEQDHKNRIEELIGKINEATTAELDRIGALDDLKQAYPGIIEKYITEEGHLRNLIALKKELAEFDANKKVESDANSLKDIEFQIKIAEQSLKTAEANGQRLNAIKAQESLDYLYTQRDLARGDVQENQIKQWKSYLKNLTDEQIKAAIEEKQRLASALKSNDDKVHIEEGSLFGKFTKSQIQDQINSLTDVLNSRNQIEVKNKEFWENQKKKAQEAMDAMDLSQKGSDEWIKHEKSLQEAQGKLKAWDFSSKSSGDKNNEAAQLKITAANRLRVEQDYAEKLKVQAKRTELEIAQSEIDGMAEGLDKQLRQINLNYNKLIFENEQRRSQMVKGLQDLSETQWNQEHPKARENGETFDRSSVGEASLSSGQLEQIKAFEDAANKYRVDANKHALEEALSDVQTYEQQRTKIAEDFEKKRKSLYTEDGSLREGVTQGNVEELGIAETDAITAIDEEFAQREDTFEAWMNAIAEMSLNQLYTTLQQAEAELAKLEQSGATGSVVALARTNVNKTRDAIAKTNADNKVSPGKKELKDWEELQDAIYSADSALGDIEDSLEGTAKDIVKTARQIGDATTRIIDGIVLLANSAISGAQTTAVGAAAAIATVEKASVILAIISAALMIVTQMFALFSKKDVVAAFNKELSNLNDELERAKLAAQIGNDERESIFGEDSWMHAIDNINAANEALKRYNDTLNDIKNIKKYPWMSDKLAEQLGFDNRSSSAEEAIKNMQLQIQHSTWFRSAKYQALGTLPGLFENGELNMDALKEFADSDMFEKLSEENQRLINDMIADWDLYQEALNEVKDYLSDLFGDLGSTMTDALVDAFANGTDAAQAFTDSVSEMLEQLAKQMIYSVTLAPLAQKAEEDMLNIMKNTGLSDEEKFAKMTGVIDEFVDNAIDRQDMANDLMKRIQDSAAGYGYDIFKAEEEERKSAAKGIGSISQDSADELNGRFTAIQYMTFEINNNVKMLTENSSQSLRHLAGIETNTGRLEAIEKNIISMNRTLGDMQLKGVKII